MTQWKYIVVGAGSAGATFAARRAAAGDRVLLLDAGPDYRSSELPDVWRSPNPMAALMDPQGWEGLMYPELEGTRTEGQDPATYWRGRGLGGSSTINGQIAIRPPMLDFDDWAAEGCAGWSGAEILPYFAKLESDGDFSGEPYHGADGPIPIYRAPRDTWGPADRALADGAQAVGIPWIDDINAPNATGVSTYPINSREFRRVSVNDAYLEPQRENPNLTVRGGSTVDRVLFDGDRAVGVRIVTEEGAVEEFADEVILAAGAVHTPTILLRSGIGPRAALESIEVAQRAELPVGEGLQDHLMVLVDIVLSAALPPVGALDRHTNIAARIDSGDPEGKPQDLMLVSLNQNVLAMEFADTSHGAAAIGVWLNQAYSRGRIVLRSADPLEQPFVEERMLSDERDLRRMRTAARLLADICRTAEVSAIAEVPVERSAADFYAAIDSGDDAQLDAYLLARGGDAQHATSTCRMGAADDPRSVVDTECRVIGFQALRVIDASVFPSVPRANTHLAVVAIAEAMADRVAR